MGESCCKRVLVVDDEPSYRSMVQNYLGLQGYACDGAEDGEEALERLREHPCDLLITDIRMGRLDGLQLLKKVHELGLADHVIIMTGHAGDYSYSDLIEAGAADFLAKPFEMGELKAKLQRLERERRMTQLLRSSHETLARECRLKAVMADLSKALLSGVPLEEISQLTLARARELTQSACGCLVQLDPGASRPSRWTVSEGTAAVSHLPEDPAVYRRCLALIDRFDGDRRVLVENAVEESSEAGRTTPGGTLVRRFLSAPIVLGGTLSGMLCLANSERDYTEHDTHVIGRLVEICGLAIQRKLSEESLAQAKEYIEKVFENSADAIGIVDRHGRATKWNRVATEVFGYALEDLIGKKVFDLYADKGQLEDMLTQLRRDGTIRRYEIDIRKMDGSVAPFELSISLLRSVDGLVQGSVCVARDLSETKKSLREARELNERLEEEILERKRADEKSQKAHTQMAQLVASIPSILIGLSNEDHVVWWNASAEETFGLTQHEVLGRPLRECPLKWDWERVLAGISRCRLERSQQRLDDVPFVRPDGTEAFMGISISPMVEMAGEGSGLIFLARDVTARKHMESLLAQAQKLESIGQLAAGIAHEINTPTQYVGDNTRFLQDAFRDLQRLLDRYAEVPRALAEGMPAEELAASLESAAREADLDYLREEIPKAIEQSLEGIERVTKIVRAMKEFSHPGTEEKTAIDLNNAIESTLTVARNEWKYVAEVVTDFDPSLPLVPCLPGELNQVILNMIINAAHAIAEVVDTGAGEKGTIRVSTRQVGEEVEIRLSDNGTGIPEALRGKIFDPFFTTKEVGKGTGQGLAISRSVIVDKHAGSIAVESEMGKGTTFIVRLPIAASAV